MNLQKKHSYKGFDLSYQIHFDKSQAVYQAKGQIISDKANIPTFTTESKLEAVAEKELIKLMENYIDFEWSAFIDSQDV